jgi:hypothetical protein
VETAAAPPVALASSALAQGSTVIASWTAEKTFASVVFSSDAITTGETHGIWVDGTPSADAAAAAATPPRCRRTHTRTGPRPTRSVSGRPTGPGHCEKRTRIAQP